MGYDKIRKELTVMKFCTKCGTQCDDAANCCHSCGNRFAEAAAAAPAAVPYVDPTDHTAEFDKKDISDNKVVAMLCYLLSVFGLIIACLLSSESKYVQFHVRTCLKITVIEALLGLCLIVPFLGWLVFVVGTVTCLVLRIIAFFQICCGKAKDPAIISSLGFLK